MNQIARALLLGAAAMLLAPGLASADSKVPLLCAGRYRAIVDVQVELREHAPNLMSVSFGDTLPPKNTLDWVLRDCLRTAIKLDSKHDIIVRAWQYKGSAKTPTALELYSKQQTLVYRASRRKVMLVDPETLADGKP